MKKTTQFIGLTALVAVITLAFAACEQPAGPKKLAETVSIKAHECGLYVGAELTAVYNGPEAPLSYQWEKDGKAVPGETSIAYTPTEAGSYTVTVSKKDYKSITSEAVDVTLVTVTFNPNGGNWDGSTESKTALNTAIVGKPETAPAAAEDKVSRTTFSGWYTEASGNTCAKWDFDNVITEDKTLYARWEYETPLTVISDITLYFAGTEGIIGPANGTPADDPAPLSVEIVLGEPDKTDSGWANLLAAIDTAGKYVALDLSTSTMTGTEFNNPDAKTGKDKIVSLTLPNVATSMAETIWDGATAIITFHDYDNLRTFVAANITSIDYAFFYECTSLTTVSFPKATSIGEWAFSNCTSLTTVSFPEATSIGERAFSNCTSLTTVSSPKATSIGEWAFFKCTSLESVSFAEATSIGKRAFNNCTSLTTADFPEVTSIGDQAFYGCTSLESVDFPKVTSIGGFVFQDTSLTSITIAANVTIDEAGGNFGVFRTYYEYTANKAAGTYVYNEDSGWSKQE